MHIYHIVVCTFNKIRLKLIFCSRRYLKLNLKQIYYPIVELKNHTTLLYLYFRNKNITIKHELLNIS